MSLFQWKGGSRMFCGPLEGVVELLTNPYISAVTTPLAEDNGEEGEGSGAVRIGVKVRGPPGTRKLCFYFLEELLGIIDQVWINYKPQNYILKTCICSLTTISIF